MNGGGSMNGQAN